MRATRGTFLAVSLVALWAPATRAGEMSEKGAQHAGDHTAMNVGEVKWGPAPEALPRGAQAAVIQGDPAVEGQLFTVRLKMPKGYAIPPHTHPTDEHVTVLSGKFYVGEGDRIDKKSGKELRPGGWASIPKDHHHYAVSDAAGTIVQVHAMGPFQINYLDPKDDPRTNVATGTDDQQRSRAGRAKPNR